MKVVIACDSFKSCLSSNEVAKHLASGILQENPNHQVISYAIGDGGEGTLEAFYETCHGKYIKVKTVDAYLKKIEAQYVLIDNDKTAVIEVAQIIGLAMYPREKRMPMYASSYGVGLVLIDAFKKGVTKIIIGLGGSSTCDGGMGLLQALGAKFYDNKQNELNPQAVNLENIDRIDVENLYDFKGIELIAACDVKNQLLGESGATYVFGKQKGLYPNQMKRIENGMHNYVNRMYQQTKIDLNACIGGGAAGGIGTALISMLNAKMERGIELLLSYSDIEDEIADCDLVITGEGQSDLQTKYGKVPVGILEIATKYNKPVICISGALGLEYRSLYDLGFIGIYSIADRAMSFQQALDNAAPKLEATAYAIIKTIEAFRNEDN
ncbi:MAG: glycerate kinase [Erysipelotrichaceae bacterium]